MGCHVVERFQSSSRLVTWTNGGQARYQIGIGERIFPPPAPNPEDPPPFLDLDVDLVAGWAFQTPEPGEDGGEVPDGSVDTVATFSFVPEPGATYVVQARLDVDSTGLYTGGATDAGFGSTAALVRVVVPEGVSFASAAGASYPVEVPEPSAALLVVVALGSLSTLRRWA